MKKRTSIDQLLPTLKTYLPKLSKEYSIKSLGVFGSYIRGEQKRDSDLDILVEFHETPGLLTYIKLENELSQILGTRVDLVMKKTLKPVIGEHILSEVVYV